MSEPASARTYSTGEVAEHCGVSVRTVQYYDRQGLLEPSGTTPAGRRIYTHDDVLKLEYILMLKATGLSLAAIRTIMESPYQMRMLVDLLDDQQDILEREIKDRERKLAAIRQLNADVQMHGRLTLSTRIDMANTMHNRTSWKHFVIAMLIVSVLMEALWICGLICSIQTGHWWVFITCLAVAVVGLGAMTRRYYRHVTYWDPQSQEEFTPKFWPWFFAQHTVHTRKLRVPATGDKVWCVEHFHA